MTEHADTMLQHLQQDQLESHLFKTRKIFLWSAIDDETAKAVVARLLALEDETPEAEISLYINSPGGATHAGLAIYDAMQTIRAPVSTICTGMAASMSSLLLAGGATGRRFAWPHARIMMHQPLLLGTVTGVATDLDIRAREMLRLRDNINRLYAHHTGQEAERIAHDTDRDYWMSAAEARDYGLIDAILTTTVPEVHDTTEPRGARSQ
jgi:ATP-dependent Clp protease protease subunit